MKIHRKIALAVAAVAATAIATTAYMSATSGHVGPNSAYPDPQLTPGFVATTNL